MKQLLYTFLFLFAFLQVQSQTTVYKKTAQRRDDFVNNAWKGKDSFLFFYNNDTMLTTLQSLQFSANNTWDNFYKYTYTINGIGKVGSQLRENWNAGNWVNNTLYTYTYDGNGYLIQTIYEVWNGTSWAPTGKIEYTGYNNNGKYQNEYVSGYSGANWVYQTRRNRSYVNNQTLIEYDDKYLWDVPTSTWIKWERLYHTYVQNEIGSTTQLVPDTAGNWAPKNKYNYNYNLNPLHLTEYLSQTYDSIALNWQNVSRVTYAYTGNNLLDKTQNELYLNNIWNPTERAQYIYNVNDLKTEYFTEISNLGNWVKNTRSTYTYTNSLLSEEQQFTGSGNNWIPSKKLTYLYDVDSNLNYEKSELYGGGVFTPASQAFYYYASFVVGIGDVSKTISELLVFPNPAKDKINIQFDADANTQLQVRVMDLTGKVHLIMSLPVFAKQNLITIPLQSLSNSFYFAEITDLSDNKRKLVKFQVEN